MPSTVSLMVVLALWGGCAAREAPAPPPTATASNDASGDAPGGGGCRTDAECGKGQVCVSCGKESSCIAGCTTSADCPSGEVCSPVQCIRCPCPPLCRKP